MNSYFLASAALMMVSAAIHSGLGEYLILTRMDADHLPATPFGGPRMTFQLLRGTWHLLSFVWLGLAAGLVFFSDTGLAHTVAALFALMGLGMLARDPKMAWRHPAPLLFLSVAVTAWLGCS